MKIEKLLILFIAIALLLALGACNAANTPETNSPATGTTAPSQPSAANTSEQSGSTAETPAPTSNTPTVTDDETAREPENIATLCADFSGGSSEPNIEQYELGYQGELTPEILTDGLTDLTGLDFSADVVRTEMGFVVLWKDNSTLIANLDGREQKEGFVFFDEDSMRWFMMDSLYRTLLENFGEDAVFYSMGDSIQSGCELEFEELYPTNRFPAGIPYMGSPFYFAHADGRGHIYEEDEASSYLLEKLTEAGIDMQGAAIVAEREEGDPWFGEMAVWYFAWGENTPEKFTAQKHFAITYDWEVWEYDTPNDEWTLWN